MRARGRGPGHDATKRLGGAGANIGSILLGVAAARRATVRVDVSDLAAATASSRGDMPPRVAARREYE
mgnify:CR=1 FL=1